LRSGNHVINQLKTKSMKTLNAKNAALQSTAALCVTSLHKAKTNFALKQKLLVILFALWGYVGFGQVISNISSNCGSNICRGGTAVLTANNNVFCSPITYQWYNSSGAIIGATGQQYTLDPPTTNVLGANYVSCTAYCSYYGYQTIVYNYNVVNPTGPLPSVTESSLSCPLDSVHLMPGANTSSTMSSSYLVGNNNIVPYTYPSTYTVALSNTAGTCSTEETFIIHSPAITTCSTPFGFTVLTATNITPTTILPAGNLVINANTTITS
jgi:hypothetical protein